MCKRCIRQKELSQIKSAATTPVQHDIHFLVHVHVTAEVRNC
jgi:hypothetical protein